MVDILTPHQSSPDSPLSGEGVSLLLVGIWLPTWCALTPWVGGSFLLGLLRRPLAGGLERLSQLWRGGGLDSHLAFPGRGGAFTLVSGWSSLIIV